MTDPGSLVILALLLPAATFVLLALAYPLRRRGRAAGIVSVLGAAGALAAALRAWQLQSAEGFTRIVTEWIPQESGSLATVGVLADADSTVMLVLVALVSFLVQLYSLGYLDTEPPASLGRYFVYQSLFAFSMMGLVLAPGFVQLFICWELVGLCSYLLIGYWYERPEAARAAVKAFWTTKAGDVGLLVGIVLLWFRAGTFDFLELYDLVRAGQLPLAGLGLVTFCIYLGAVGKSAQFPLHVWLPDAMEGPTPVSALIHAATMVTAGVYLLKRTNWLFALTPDVLLLVGWIGAFTALLAAVLACVQSDIKRVLAYSTVSQLGYMMAAMGAGFAAAGFLHLLTHGIFKALLFLGRGGGDPRGGQQRHLPHGRAAPAHAADDHRVPGGHAVPRRHPALRRLLLEGRDPGRGVERRPLGAVLDAGDGGVPHRVLHVPRGVHRLLRRSGGARATGAGGARRPRRPPAAATSATRRR